GGDGGLHAVAARGLLDGAGRAAIAGVTTELASKKRPGIEAVYRLTTAHAGAPEWVRAEVYVVVNEDRTTEGASFIFVPGGRGEPVLILAEPHPDPRPARNRDGRGGAGRDNDSEGRQ
ncbi:MAG TPA: hypothetical protein VGV67_07390, partial [Solirubrobacteraceae bacterium]|nr:hypothetical protein [Solirubrobacteraceae bacterium]